MAHEVDLKKQPVLVTGSHRSGSTWVGRILGVSNNLAYLQEPFNPNNQSPYIPPQLFRHWYTEISSANQDQYIEFVSGLLGYRTYVIKNFISHPSYTYAKYCLSTLLESMGNKLYGKRPLIKDPFALMSIDWLLKTYPMKIIGVYRHPAAFVSSVLIKGWDFDFGNFVNQPGLLEGELQEYKEDIEQANDSEDKLLRAAILWKCLNGVLLNAEKKYPDNVFTVKHEDISTEPLYYFETVFSFIGEPMTVRIKEEILRTTQGAYDTHSTPSKNVTRDSRKNIFVWKDRLTNQQISKIKSITNSLSCKLYSEDTW